MSPKNDLERIPTGIETLDALLSGGVPAGSVIVVGGPPGSGKTVLTQQICFHNAASERPVLYLNTLSEPTAKTLLHLSQFDFFDPGILARNLIHFIDIGGTLHEEGLEKTSARIAEYLKAIRPGIIVIDSFKVFDDLAQSNADLRRFAYGLAVNLMAWQTTTFLLGEFSPQDIATNPVFSIVDGLFVLSQRQESGEQQRFLQVVKMRGTDHSRNEHAFEITRRGIDLFAPRLTARRVASADLTPTRRMKTGISKLDELLGDGIPLGSSLLVGGVAGTGKTVLLLEFLYRGALAGEKGILFSFEETEERLRAAAAGLGWEFDRMLDSGMIEIVFIPQPEIAVEKHLTMIQRRIEAAGAVRVAMDSVSVFLHKVRDPEKSRELVFEIASLIQNAQAVGFLATDIPYGSDHLSRVGVEETVVDGVILLSANEEGLERKRYLEVYKLRNTAHLKGRHDMTIEQGGMRIYPRYYASELLNEPPPALNPARRMSTGVPTLDPLLGGGVFERSVTLVSGSAGIGKSTLGVHFVIEGARQKEPGLFVALEEGPGQIISAAESLGLPLQAAVDSGSVEVMYLSRKTVRANQLLSVVADRIEATGARRLVLDSVGQIMTEGMHPEDLRQMLIGLTARLKTLGVTTLLTLEAHSLHSSEWATEEGFSPISDNLIMLRYQPTAAAFRPYLAVVKTRGSAHDTRKYAFGIGEGGARVGDPLSDLQSEDGKTRP